MWQASGRPAYEQFKATGVPIDHTVSHAYATMGNTVSCYFLDPEGNRLGFRLVGETDWDHHFTRRSPGKSVGIPREASGLVPAATH